MMNTQKKLPTVEEANRLQAEWMALDSTGPRKEIDRVCKAYKALPVSYISQSDSGQAQVLIHGMPTTADNRTIEEAEQLAAKCGVQTVLRWNSKGYWFAVSV
jgi:hypothetical protein